jgi:hypothetical protein
MQETSNRLRGRAKNLLPFSPKDRIDHYVFGLGTIVAIDERRIMIEFDESGTRKFVTSMVKLTPSDTPAPAKRPRTRKKVGRSG